MPQIRGCGERNPHQDAVPKAVRKNGTFLCYEANLAKHGLKGTPFGHSFTALKQAGHSTGIGLASFICPIDKLLSLMDLSPLSEAKQETTRYAGGDKELNKNSLNLLQ